MSDSLKAMTATLAALGISDELIGGEDSKIIAESPPELHEMGATYQTVNDYLGGLLRKGSLSIAHITGEARAIVDPAHRRILRRAAGYGQQTSVACTFTAGGDGRVDAWRFVECQHEHWGPMRWFDLIDVLELAARRLIRICRLAQAEDVHFSIFGDALLLLQERHHHPTAEKWVWFVESPALVTALRPRLERLLSEAVTIDPLSFDEILDWLNDYETFAELSAIASSDESEPDRATMHVRPAPARPQPPDARLRKIGLAHHDRAGLTPLGREWLASMTAQSHSG
jgi:hypothetical protein